MQMAFLVVGRRPWAAQKFGTNDRMISMKRHVGVVLVIAVLTVLVSCGKGETRKEITESRAAAPPSQPASPHGSGMEMPPNPHAMAAQPFSFATPEGWTSVPPTSMRVVNFKIGAPPEAECYVSALRGTGGGTEMNLNRWRGQMGVTGAPLTQEDIDKLPKVSILGKQEPLLEASGEYRGMSDKAQPGYMLLGTVCEMEPESVFVKMIGPEVTVRANHDKFVAFCESLKRATPPAAE